MTNPDDLLKQAAEMIERLCPGVPTLQPFRARVTMIISARSLIKTIREHLEKGQ